MLLAKSSVSYHYSSSLVVVVFFCGCHGRYCVPVVVKILFIQFVVVIDFGLRSFHFDRNCLGLKSSEKKTI